MPKVGPDIRPTECLRRPRSMHISPLLLGRHHANRFQLKLRRLCTTRQGPPKTEFIEWRIFRHVHCFGRICSCLHLRGPCSLAYTPTTEKTRMQGLDCRNSARHLRGTGFDEVRRSNETCGYSCDKCLKGTGKHECSTENIEKPYVYDLFALQSVISRNLSWLALCSSRRQTIRITAHTTILRWWSLMITKHGAYDPIHNTVPK